MSRHTPLASPLEAAHQRLVALPLLGIAVTTGLYSILQPLCLGIEPAFVLLPLPSTPPLTLVVPAPTSAIDAVWREALDPHQRALSQSSLALWRGVTTTLLLRLAHSTAYLAPVDVLCGL